MNIFTSLSTALRTTAQADLQAPASNVIASLIPQPKGTSEKMGQPNINIFSALGSCVSQYLSINLAPTDIVGDSEAA